MTRSRIPRTSAPRTGMPKARDSRLHFELLMKHLGSVVMRVDLLRLLDEEEEKERGAEQQQNSLNVNVEVIDDRSVVPKEPEHQKAVRDRDDAEDRVAQPVDPAVFDGPQLGDHEGCGRYETAGQNLVEVPHDQAQRDIRQVTPREGRGERDRQYLADVVEEHEGEGCGPPDLVAPMIEMENGEQGKRHVQGGHREQRTLENVGHELEHVVDDQPSGIDRVVTFVAAQKRLEKHVEDVRLHCGEHYVQDGGLGIVQIQKPRIISFFCVFNSGCRGL